MIGRREIGGYLELECFRGPMLHEGDIALNCGRACLEYLIELRNICTLWLPDFLCSSVPNLCCKAGVEVKTYHIGESFRAVLDFQIAEEEWLYLVDYYGQLTQGDVDEALVASGGRLIIDESQGYYREPWLDADTLYTCRKWFGVADGAFLHTKDGAKLARALPRSESFDKMGFLLGRFERSAGEFFTDSKINNVRFADEPMAGMSAITENLLRAIEYGDARARRRDNWSFLEEALGPSNLLALEAPAVPFMYPYMVMDPEGVRQDAAVEGVYIPELWPNVSRDSGAGSASIGYSSNILPLPVDQRYGRDDLNYLVDVLRSLL
ncbi:MAG: hypothetical protein UEJ46_01180 [Eggerthellaceae bacterium]|nr:hypothetical protein [Eggerthellaceae bacterium]